MGTQAPSSLTRLGAPLPPGRHWRRPTRLPPGAPVVIPDGLPLFWDARLAFARLCQIYRRVIQAPTLPDRYRWRSGRLPAVVKELARDCRITVGPWPSRVVTRCPTCGAEVYLLRGTARGWGCRRCYADRWSQLEVCLGTYAMGLQIGLRGRPMVRRQRRLIRALARLGHSVRSARGVWLLAAGTALLENSPHWPRRHPRAGEPRCPRDPGPLLRKIGPHFLTAVIDQTLHPTAFFQRFSAV